MAAASNNIVNDCKLLRLKIILEVILIVEKLKHIENNKGQTYKEQHRRRADK